MVSKLDLSDAYRHAVVHDRDRELQYCAKVMQAIIVEYRENRDISAIFNAN